MKVELRSFKTRDGAVVVNLDRQTEPNDFDLAWLEKVSEIGCIVAGAIVALAWLVIGG